MTGSNDARKATSRNKSINSTLALKPPKPYLEFEEALALANAATNLRDQLLIRLLLHTGCRISEALALKVDDIDFANSTITIKHLKASLRLSCSKCGARLSRNAAFCPGCGEKVAEAVASQKEHRRQRIIPIDRDTIELLRGYIKRGGAVEKGGKKVIFGITRHRAWQIVKDCAERTGLPPLTNPESGRTHHVSPHRLRDCFAIGCVKKDDSGDGLRMLQEHLGHQSIATTMGYRKVAGQELKIWYERIWQKHDGDGVAQA